jgi:transposase-like protein
VGVDIISGGIEPHPKYKFLTIFLFILILIPATYATTYTSTSKSVSAHNVELTNDYVKATGICSCGLNDYKYHTKSFKNYCPHCKSYGTLIFNPKGVPEGEWTCTKCSSDYCLADGTEKMPNTPYCLVTYKSPEVQAQEIISVKVKTIYTHLGKFKDKSFLESY